MEEEQGCLRDLGMRQASMRLPLKVLIWPSHSYLRKENPDTPGPSQHLRWNLNSMLSPGLGQNMHDGGNSLLNPQDPGQMVGKT